MPLFILATTITPSVLHTPATLEQLGKRVTEAVHAECPDVHWRQSFAVSGPFDYLDVLDAPTLDDAVKASVLVRSHGQAHTELWPALEWPRFKEMVHGLPPGDVVPLPVDMEE